MARGGLGGEEDQMLDQELRGPSSSCASFRTMYLIDSPSLHLLYRRGSFTMAARTLISDLGSPVTFKAALLADDLPLGRLFAWRPTSLAGASSVPTTSLEPTQDVQSDWHYSSFLGYRSVKLEGSLRSMTIRFFSIVSPPKEGLDLSRAVPSTSGAIKGSTLSDLYVPLPAGTGGHLGFALASDNTHLHPLRRSVAFGFDSARGSSRTLKKPL